MGFAFYAMCYAGLLMLIAVIGLGILYARTRTWATASLFFGQLLSAVTQWLVGEDTSGPYIVYAFMGAVGSAMLAFGILFYALSLQKRAPNAGDSFKFE